MRRFLAVYLYGRKDEKSINVAFSNVTLYKGTYGFAIICTPIRYSIVPYDDHVDRLEPLCVHGAADELLRGITTDAILPERKTRQRRDVHIYYNADEFGLPFMDVQAYITRLT